MTISFCSTKSDQEGEITNDVKRLYANPFKPEICVVLKLAVHILCHRRTTTGTNMRVFEGKNQNKRYWNILMQVIFHLIPDHYDIGCAREDIGTHSNRKFAESTAASRVDGPSRTQVCLRAGQSVGQVQDCYMKSEDDGDALVGRTVAQLKFTADEFDVLPPHFTSATLIEVGDIGWEKFFPDYNMYPERFKVEVMPKLLASLVYHYENGNLARLYPPDHLLFQQMMFTDVNLLRALTGKVVLAFESCGESHMYATGVPGVISLAREVRVMRAEIQVKLDAGHARMDQVEQRVTSVVEDQPAAIVEQLLDRFQVNGVVPVTRGDITAAVNNALLMEDGPISTLVARMDAQDRAATRAAEPVITADEGDVQNNSHAMLHLWRRDGFFHTVPEGFIFPSYSVSTMWNLWIFGNSVTKVCRFRHIDARDLVERKQCKVNLSRCKKVMVELINIACRANMIASVTCISKGNDQEVFEYAYNQLLTEVYDRPPSRPASINVNTIANRIKRR